MLCLAFFNSLISGRTNHVCNAEAVTTDGSRILAAELCVVERGG